MFYNIENTQKKKYSNQYIYLLWPVKKQNLVTIIDNNAFPNKFSLQLSNIHTIFENSLMLKKTIQTRKKIFSPLFNIMYIWANCWSLAYYIRSQFTRGINAASILFAIKRNIPYSIKGIFIQLTGRMTGAARATKKKYVFGTLNISSVASSTEYAYLKVQSRFGVSSIKILLNHTY